MTGGSPLDEIELGMYIDDRLKRRKRFTRVIPAQFKEQLESVVAIVKDTIKIEDIDDAIYRRCRFERLKPHYVKLEQELKEDDDGVVYDDPWYGPDGDSAR